MDAKELIILGENSIKLGEIYIEVGNLMSKKELSLVEKQRIEHLNKKAFEIQSQIESLEAYYHGESEA